MEHFTRQELAVIEERALKQADDVLNPAWERALIALADSANCIDAMIARTEQGTKTDE